MSDEERAARGARDRRQSSVTEEAKRAWAEQAEALSTHGLALIEAASTALLSKRPGRAGATLDRGLKLLEAADRLYARLGRITTPTPIRPAPAGAGAPSLEEHRRRRPHDGA